MGLHQLTESPFPILTFNTATSLSICVHVYRVSCSMLLTYGPKGIITSRAFSVGIRIRYTSICDVLKAELSTVSSLLLSSILCNPIHTSGIQSLPHRNVINANCTYVSSYSLLKSYNLETTWFKSTQRHG